MKPPLDSLPDPAKGRDVGIDPLVTPAVPGGWSDARASQDWVHLQARLGGLLFKGSDLRVNHGPDYVHDCTVQASTNASPATLRLVQLAGMVDEGDQARALLKQALEVTGLTPYALAKKAGIAPTTITRPLNDPLFKFVPKQGTLNKIAAAAGLTPPTLPEPNLTVEPVTQWVPLIGEVRAGVWTEIPDEPVVEDRIPVNLPEYARASLFAVRVAGRSMDLKYSDGETVIAVVAVESGVRVGDDVIVRRRQGQLCETTLKEIVQETDGSLHLYPRSSDVSFKPIPLRSSDDADEGLEIIGVVLYSINPRRSGRGPLINMGGMASAG